MASFFALLAAFVMAMMILSERRLTTDDDPWGFQ